ncbi:hypothetical protein [Tessaracoccus lacteus]|uniref:Uncharacterized protein n=1 Tax=Tessaracoccus lacteus TaxID=3041766 RepID=A0ABY8PYQ4_9ACTN|nr:hypothetical protein [Tessaracoccus sp. T21]WGT47532.1 hypothetical protein QH948_01730 [Tessaracoccus sp. T21]
MSKLSVFVKTAGGIVATTTTLLALLRDNPQISQAIDGAVAKLKETANSENPRLRLDAKIKAIEVAADAVEASFPDAREPAGWRRQASALRLRLDLAWTANTGTARKKALKALTAETLEVLSEVNARLIELQGQHPADPTIEP